MVIFQQILWVRTWNFSSLSDQRDLSAIFHWGRSISAQLILINQEACFIKRNKGPSINVKFTASYVYSHRDWGLREQR